MSWNIADNRNLVVKLKSKLEVYHVLLMTQKNSPEKLTLTVLKMHPLPNNEKIVSKEEKSCLKRTIINGRRKVCANFNTDTDNLIIVVYPVTETICTSEIKKIDLKMTQYQPLLAKRDFFELH